MIDCLKKTCLILSLLSIHLLGLGSSTTNTTTTVKTPPGTYIDYCPNPIDLTKNPIKLTWSTAPPASNIQPEFQGYEKSFANKLTKFLGAQWNGVNLGKIICLYQGESQETFPVQLFYDILVLTPTTGQWVKKKGYYSNCDARDPKQCPFLVKKQPKKINVDNVLKNIKAHPSTNPYENSDP
jgi:hypothetical protein